MPAEVFFEPENEEFNLYGAYKKRDLSGKFNQIKWKPNQLELFRRFKEIKQNIWIQIYDVYLDKLENVVEIGFRITPVSSFYHEYPDIEFDENGLIVGDLKEELKDIKDEDKEEYKLVHNFYKVLIKLQSEQEKNIWINHGISHDNKK